MEINTKEKLIDVLFKFHNDVNLRTGKGHLSREVLVKYKSSNLNKILKLFLERFFVSYIGRRHFDDWVKNRVKDKTYVFYCASAWRSALAAKIAMEMGLNPVVHLEGGYSEWIKQGGSVEIINKK